MIGAVPVPVPVRSPAFGCSLPGNTPQWPLPVIVAAVQRRCVALA